MVMKESNIEKVLSVIIPFMLISIDRISGRL